MSARGPRPMAFIVILALAAGLAAVLITVVPWTSGDGATVVAGTEDAPSLDAAVRADEDASADAPSTFDARTDTESVDVGSDTPDTGFRFVPAEYSACLGDWVGSFTTPDGCTCRDTFHITGPPDVRGSCGTHDWDCPRGCQADGVGEPLLGCVLEWGHASFTVPQQVNLACDAARPTVAQAFAFGGSTRLRRVGTPPPNATAPPIPASEHPCNGTWTGSCLEYSYRITIDLTRRDGCGRWRYANAGTSDLMNCEVDGFDVAATDTNETALSVSCGTAVPRFRSTSACGSGSFPLTRAE